MTDYPDKPRSFQPSAEEAAVRRAQEGVVTPQERAAGIMTFVTMLQGQELDRAAFREILITELLEAESAAYERGRQQGAAEEREACAVLIEWPLQQDAGIGVADEIDAINADREECAAAIRARRESDDGE